MAIHNNTEYLVNNGKRYEVTIPSYFKEEGFIIY